ncbi:putative uncharacterized protein DKFZp468F0819 [Mycolicibacterium novocastrense]|uniref:Uncharacterized protein n=1 Tax=Mycolicibacterium novocastrense TaxID=59813 RepID=A0ABQ0KGF3_MYCNV|nr:putative uncharacterized protein DKFZp468F0819 [Mycolicibacterium novocastrense]
MLGDGGRQLPRQHGIDLDGGHPRAAVEQCQRQRAQSGPDLENVVMLVDTGRRNDSPYGVGVMDEVLSERFARPEVDRLRQLSYLGPPE